MHALPTVLDVLWLPPEPTGAAAGTPRLLVVPAPGIGGADLRRAIMEIAGAPVRVTLVTALPPDCTHPTRLRHSVAPLDEASCASAEEGAMRQGIQAIIGLGRASSDPHYLHLDDLYAVPEPPAAREAGPPESESESALVPELDSERLAEAETPALPDAPELPDTVTALLDHAAGLFPEHGARFLSASGSVRLTYPDLLREAERMASGLHEAGVQAGDHVILQLAEHQEFVVAMHGCMRLGAVPVPMAPAPLYQAGTPQASSMLTACNVLERVSVLCPRRNVGELRSFLADQSTAVRVLAVEELPQDAPPPQVPERSPDDVALMLMTSGSTGRPKGVPLRHRQIVACIRATAAETSMTAQDVVLNWLPLDHPGPLIRCSIRPLLLGAEQIHGPTAMVLQNPLVWLDWMAEHQVTNAWAPNFAFSLLRDRKSEIQVGSWDLSRLRCLLNTAEPIVVTTVREVQSLLAPFGLKPETMVSSWGMAETSSGVTQNNRFIIDQVGPEGDKFADLGAPIPGVAIRIVDDQGQVVRERVRGHIQVRGTTVLHEYFRDPEMTRANFSSDGWFKTGDLGMLHEGRLTISGRSKDLIIVSGRNLYSHEVESAVELVAGATPSFTAACGIRRAGAETDQLAVFVVPEKGVVLRDFLAEVRSAVTRKTGITPRWVVPVERADIPKTSIGKIQRARLKERFENGELDVRAKESDLLLGNEGTVPDWFFEKQWCRAAVADPAPLPDGPWLVFERGEELAGALKDTLGASAHVVCVQPGAAPRFEGEALTVRPGNRADVEVLLEKFAPRGIIYAWSWSPPATGAELTEGRASDEVAGALALLGTLCGTESDAPAPSVQFVTSGVARVPADDGALVPERAALPAMVRCAVREAAHLRLRCLDVAGAASDVLLALRHELAAGRVELDVAYRGALRFVPRLVPASESVCAGGDAAPVQPRGRYVITGGLGGIGRTLAAHLLDHYAAHLLLLGRAPLSGRTERQAALEALERRSGSVRYVAVDLEDTTALEAALTRFEAETGPVDGVFHLAGTAPERLLVEETPQTFGACVAPKGRIAMALSNARPNALFVSLSSLMGFFGGATMSAYCAANVVAETVALELRRQGRRAHCLASSTWSDTGMSRGHAGSDAVRAQGHHTMRPEQALASLFAMLKSGVPVLSVGLDGDSPHVAPWTSGPTKNAEGLFGVAVGLTARTRWDWEAEGASVPVTLAPVDSLPQTDDGKPDRASAVRLAQGRASREPETPVERRLLELWQDTLGSDVTVQDNFFELGGDSVKALTLLAALRAEFGTELDQAAVFRAPTVEELAALIDSGEPGNQGVVMIRAARGSAHCRLFLVHDADGNTLLYRGLAERLPESVEVLGLPPATDDKGVPLQTRVRDMAVWNADRILDQASSAESIAVGGLCAGGALAFETAAELEGRGYTVGSVLLLDAAHPHAVQRAQQRANERLQRTRNLFRADKVWSALPKLAAKSVRGAEYEWNLAQSKRRHGAALQALRKARDRNAEVSPEAAALGTRALYSFAKRGFEPRPVRSSVLLVRASQASEEELGFDDTPIREVCADPQFGWLPLAQGELKVVDVPGGHSTMLQAPHVDQVAACVRGALAELPGFAPPPIDGSRVAVITVNYRTPDLVLDMLDSLDEERDEVTGFHVFILDSASGDGSETIIPEGIRSRGYGDWVTFISLEKNGGFAYGNNAGIAAALDRHPDIEFFHLLNPDTLVRRGAVRTLVEHLMRHREVGVAFSSLEDRAGVRRPTRFKFPRLVGEIERALGLGPLSRLVSKWSGTEPGVPAEPVEVEWGPGASLMVRRSVVDTVGLLDERFFLYFEETEWLLRIARAGWRRDYVPSSRVVHLIGESTGVTKQSTERKQLPTYWFESRRHYFEASFGVSYAEATDGAYLAALQLRLLLDQALGRRDSGPVNLHAGTLQETRYLRRVRRRK